MDIFTEKHIRALSFSYPIRLGKGKKKEQNTQQNGKPSEQMYCRENDLS